MGLLFTGAVIVPSILLAYFAVRAVSHERAFIERQLETALATEAEAVVGGLGAELERIREELGAALRLPAGSPPAPFLRRCASAFWPRSRPPAPRTGCWPCSTRAAARWGPPGAGSATGGGRWSPAR